MAWSTPRTWTPGDMVTASLLNTEIRDNGSYLLGDTAWIAPTFQNAWTNFGAPYLNAGYRKVADHVFLRGVVKSGTVGSGTPVFTLPSGYRPAVQFIVACATNNNVIGRWNVGTDGTVALNTGSNVWAMLDGLCFEVV
jgi:hypothetical protein